MAPYFTVLGSNSLRNFPVHTSKSKPVANVFSVRPRSRHCESNGNEITEITFLYIQLWRILSILLWLSNAFIFFFVFFTMKYHLVMLISNKARNRIITKLRWQSCVVYMWVKLMLFNRKLVGVMLQPFGQGDVSGCQRCARALRVPGDPYGSSTIAAPLATVKYHHPTCN